MPRHRALAIDLDGTLLQGEVLSQRNRDAVRKAADAGFRIIIATARWRQMAERIAEEIGLAELPVIACSGAQVYCTESRRDIYDTRLPAAFVDALYAICNSNRCIASATLDAHTWLKLDRQPAAEHLTDGLHWVQELPEHDELPRIATVQGTETIALVRQLHDQGWQDQVNIFDSIGPSGRTVITVTAATADKGIALSKACDHLAVDTRDVIAFGDAENDIAMFRLAGTAVAMGQASEQVQSVADHITASNLDDGVAAFIESHLL